MTRYCKLLYGMANAYARGAVEVLYAGTARYGSRCRRGTLYARGTVEVRSWCGRGTLVVRSRYARGAVEVRSWYGRGAVTVEVRSWYGRGTIVVRFQFASDLVRFVNFSTGDTVCVLFGTQTLDTR